MEFFFLLWRNTPKEIRGWHRARDFLENVSFFLEALAGYFYSKLELKLRFWGSFISRFPFLRFLPVCVRWERFKKLMMTARSEDETSERTRAPFWMFPLFVLVFFLFFLAGQFEFTFWQTHQFCRYERSTDIKEDGGFWPLIRACSVGPGYCLPSAWVAGLLASPRPEPHFKGSFAVWTVICLSSGFWYLQLSSEFCILLSLAACLKLA